MEGLYTIEIVAEEGYRAVFYTRKTTGNGLLSRRNGVPERIQPTQPVVETRRPMLHLLNRRSLCDEGRHHRRFPALPCSTSGTILRSTESTNDCTSGCMRLTLLLAGAS